MDRDNVSIVVQTYTGVDQIAIQNFHCEVGPDTRNKPFAVIIVTTSMRNSKRSTWIS